MLKGWFDRVFIYGAVYASQRRFEKGRFLGKRAMLSVTVGTSAETYAHDGRSGDIDLLLWPVNFSLAYVGYRGAVALHRLWRRGGLALFRCERGRSAAQADRAGLARGPGTSRRSAPSIPFNRMAEWGSDGRIKPDAPLHSPFIRRKREVELE